MFEMIYLNIDDTQLYQHHDFTQLVRKELKKADINYAVHILAPKNYTLNSGKDLPIFVSTKENNIDNDNLNTAENGYLIFSNNVTADIYVTKTFNNLKEKPHNSSNTPPPPPNSPAGWVPPKSTYYSAEYSLVKTKNVPNIAGEWTIVEHSGNFLSNSQIINISSIDNTNNSKYLDQVYLTSDQLQLTTNYSQNDLSPSFNNQAFNFEISNNKENMILNCNFSVDKNMDLSRGYLPIHIVLSSSNLNKNKIITIKIPKADINIKKDKLSGYISINIGSMYNNLDFGSISLVDDIFITLISGSNVSEIFKIPSI